MLVGGSDTSSGALGTQAEIVAIAIVEAVHFFFNNVGDFANRAFKELCLFEHRETDFAVAIAANNTLERLFKVLPSRRLRRQDIVHAADRLEFSHRVF